MRRVATGFGWRLDGDSLLSNHEHRAGRSGHHVTGNGAEQQARQAGATVGPYDDQISFQSSSQLGNVVARVGDADVRDAGQATFAGIILMIATVVGASILGTSIQACAPSAQHPRCSNGGQCEKIDPKYAYCVHGHCVECVSVASCGEHQQCKEGECVSSSN